MKSQQKYRINDYHFLFNITSEFFFSSFRKREVKITRSSFLRHSGNERHEVASAEELGDEEGGVDLGLRAIDPIQTRP